MKMIIINGRFLEQRITGVQRVAFEFVKSLDNLVANKTLNKSYVLLCPKGCSQNISLQNIDVVEVGPFHGHLWEQFTLPFYSFRKTIINLCGPAPIFKKKQIVTIHDAAIYANSQNFSLHFQLWYKFMFLIFRILSLKIITVSKFSKSELVRYCGFDPENVKPVHLGVNHFIMASEISEAREREILSQFSILDKDYILAVSSLAPNKNFKSIMLAMEHLRNQNYKLVIVGGNYSKVFNDLDIEAQSKNNVACLGYVSDEELAVLYKNASCFIYPSFYEGFGLPPIEAMSCGCPVIVSNTTSLPEVCGTEALYCDPYDIEDIALKIKTLMEDKELRFNLSKNGIVKSKTYEWNKFALEVCSEVSI